MIRIARVLLLLVLAAVLAAPAHAEERLFLWRVEGENAVVHLTGSIHVGRQDFFPLPIRMETAFHASDALAVEVDIADPAVMQQAAQITLTRGMLPGEETLQTAVAPEIYARLEEYAAERDVPLAAYAKLRPSLVAMVLVMAEYKRLGFDENLGVDRHFLDAAREAGKEIRQLETLEAQMALFLDMSDQLDDVMLEAVMDQSADIEEITNDMVAAWKNGDPETLARMLQEQMGDEPEMEEFYADLLDNRNVAIVDQIDGYLRGSDDVFVVVGAAHYGGEMGMLELLRGKGWEVVQVTR